MHKQMGAFGRRPGTEEVVCMSEGREGRNLKRREAMKKWKAVLAVFLSVVLVLQSSNIQALADVIDGDGETGREEIVLDKPTETTETSESTDEQKDTPPASEPKKEEPAEPAEPATPEEPAEKKDDSTKKDEPTQTTEPVEKAEETKPAEETEPAQTTEPSKETSSSTADKQSSPEAEAPAETPAEETDTTVTLNVEVSGAKLTYTAEDGTEQNVTPETDPKSVDVPNTFDFKFTVTPDEGQRVSSVSYGETVLNAGESGEYAVAPEDLTDGEKIVVTTEAVPAEEASTEEAPAEETPAEPETPAEGGEAVPEEETPKDTSTEGGTVDGVTTTSNDGESEDLEEGITAHSMSLRNISGQQRVKVGNSIRLDATTPDGGWHDWYREYESKWSASPEGRVRLSNAGNNGVTVTGVSQGGVTITHSWGYYTWTLFGGDKWNEVGSETYQMTVVGNATDPDDLCTVTFDTNGGSWGSRLAGTHTFYVGDALWGDENHDGNIGDISKEMGFPAREGYVFAGWDKAVDRIVSGDVKYTAQWEMEQPGKTPVYVYTRVKGDSDTSDLIINADGWYTIGVIFIDSDLLRNPDQIWDSEYGTYVTGVQFTREGLSEALTEALKSINRYPANSSIDVSGLEWHILKQADGASDYVASGSDQWHLDCFTEIERLENYTVRYVESGNESNVLAEEVTQIATIGAHVDPDDHLKSIKNYTYVGCNPEDGLTVEKDGENVLTLYYTSNKVKATVNLEDWVYGDPAATEDAKVTGGDYTEKPEFTYFSQDASGEYSVQLEGKPTNAGNYMVKASWEGTDNNDPVSATDLFEIKTRPVVASGSTSKEYDGTNIIKSAIELEIIAEEGNKSSGPIENDEISIGKIDSSCATYNSANVHQDRPLTSKAGENYGLSLIGADSSNYHLRRPQGEPLRRRARG